MRIKQTNTKLTKGMQEYVDRITVAYLARRGDYTNTYLKVDYEKQTEYFPLKQRFTELYGNSIYNKLKVLDNLRLYSFWTLTTTVDGTKIGFDRVLDLIKKGWRDLRSLLAKNGLKNLLYLRVYELTKNYGLHIHVAFYSPMTEKQIVAIAKFWIRTRGHVKIFIYSSHISSYTTSVFKRAWSPYVNEKMQTPQVMASRQESWVTGETLKFGPAQQVRIDQKVSSYIYKYMVKRPNKSHQAVLSDNKIRTYSCSMELNKIVKLMREKFKKDNYVERGEVLQVSIYHGMWAEDVVRMGQIWDRLVQRYELQPQALFNIELVLKYNETCKEQIHLEIGFNDHAFSISTTDRLYYPAKYAHNVSRSFRSRFDGPSNRKIKTTARDILLRYQGPFFLESYFRD